MSARKLTGRRARDKASFLGKAMNSIHGAGIIGSFRQE